MPQPGMVKWEVDGDITVLAGGQQPMNLGRSAEKYNKFAYSSRYAFSVEAEARCFSNGPFDNMLAFSEDGNVAHFRQSESMSRIGEDWMYSAWSPMPEVEVETWLLARPPWHLRLHRVKTKRHVHTIEGGFAIPRRDTTPRLPPQHTPLGGLNGDAPGEFATTTDTSALRDAVSPMGTPRTREPRIIAATPNTNILWPRSWVPQLTVTLEPGDWGLACWVLARPNSADSFPEIPMELIPTIEELEEMKRGGQLVEVWDL